MLGLGFRQPDGCKAVYGDSPLLTDCENLAGRAPAPIHRQGN